MVVTTPTPEADPEPEPEAVASDRARTDDVELGAVAPATLAAARGAAARGTDTRSDGSNFIALAKTSLGNRWMRFRTGKTPRLWAAAAIPGPKLPVQLRVTPTGLQPPEREIDAQLAQGVR